MYLWGSVFQEVSQARSLIKFGANDLRNMQSRNFKLIELLSNSCEEKILKTSNHVCEKRCLEIENKQKISYYTSFDWYTDVYHSRRNFFGR